MNTVREWGFWTSKPEKKEKIELIVPFSYILREFDPQEALVEMNKRVQTFLIIPSLDSILWSIEEEPLRFVLTMEFLLSDKSVENSPYNSRMELMEGYASQLGRFIKGSGVVYDFVIDITLEG